MITINIQDLTFHAFHGVHATEREIGGKYAVQIEMLADVNASCQTDDLADTVDYAAVSKRVEQIMNLPQNLIEKVAADIANALLNLDSRIVRITVTVEKHNPPLNQNIGFTSVVITQSR